MELDISSAARVLHADGAENNNEWGAGDPFLFVGDLRDLFDQATVCDHAEHPGLLIPSRRRKARRFKHFLDYIFGNRFVPEPANADAALQ